jgi:hypothetical protein
MATAGRPSEAETDVYDGGSGRAVQKGLRGIEGVMLALWCFIIKRKYQIIVYNTANAKI